MLKKLSPCLPHYRFLLLGLLLQSAAARTWTDQKGRKIEAEFKSVSKGTVILVQSSGKVINTGLNNLSEADRRYISEKLRAKAQEKAAEGNAYAQAVLGEMYENGTGGPRDIREAITWYRKAAEQGHAPGQNSLGLMYYIGTGVPQDVKEAAGWYRKAADQGNANAQYNLGMLYETGKGVPQDDRAAARWYRKAAEQGDANAQVVLGRMCAKGVGVPRDLVEAYAWFNLAGAGGMVHATKSRELLRKNMSPGLLTRARERSRELHGIITGK